MSIILKTPMEKFFKHMKLHESSDFHCLDVDFLLQDVSEAVPCQLHY